MDDELDVLFDADGGGFEKDCNMGNTASGMESRKQISKAPANFSGCTSAEEDGVTNMTSYEK